MSRGIKPYSKIMCDATVEALILDLLNWLDAPERTYEEVMDAWRTSCPRLPVWEDANDRGLVARQEAGGRTIVVLTDAGRATIARACSRTSS